MRVVIKISKGRLKKLKKRAATIFVLVLFLFSICFTNVISESASYTVVIGTVAELHNSQYSNDGVKSWESSNPSIVAITKVSSSGSDCTFRAVGIGSCDVIVSIKYQSFETKWIPDNLGGGRWGTVPVTKSDSFVYHVSVIKEQSKVITDIKLRYNSGKTICLNESFRFPVDIKSSNGWYIDTYSSLKWISSNEAIATVDDYGTVKAKTTGTATITVKTPEGLAATAQITITDFSGYTQISSKQDLSDIRNNPGGKFYLTANIVFQDSDFQSGGAFYNGGKKWIPIPNFTGVINGNNFSVENLQVDATGDAGLFSSITAQSGTISNLTIKNANIKGTGNVGAFSGYSKGVFSNCASSGSTLSGLCTGGIAGVQENGQINSCTNTSIINGDEIAGGFVGKPTWSAQIWFCTNKGSIFSSKAGDAGGIAGFVDYSNILYCINEGSVTGTYSTGGIVGRNKSGMVLYCLNKGKITSNSVGTDAGKYYNLGGIAGYMNLSSVVGDCYNTGAVVSGNNSGTANAGGITGALYINDYTPGGNDKFLYNSYNIGSISAANSNQKCNAGGIAGSITNSSSCASVTAVWNSYFLNNVASGFGFAPAGNHSDNVIALNDSQLKSSASFTGFFFESDWVLDKDNIYPYPQFKYSYNPAVGNNLTIIFRASGSDVFSSVKVQNGQAIPMPATPVLPGYVFSGWYKDAACTQAWNFSTDKVTGAITLFAKWTSKDGNTTTNSMAGTTSGQNNNANASGWEDNQSNTGEESGIQNSDYSNAGNYNENGVSRNNAMPDALKTGLLPVFVITGLILLAIGFGIVFYMKKIRKIQK